ncbi:MAG TPA: glycosyltransferase family A protein [Dehalococcoidia bacterium]|nr:glycosyltransferase family A protein [Dehalococcoidia bacterium]
MNEAHHGTGVSEPGAREGGEAAPRVSVVIPTRNRADYLREALCGIAAGELQNFEVLVMDQTDGDATECVVAGFDSRFHYRRMPRNGACPARNLGAALARAEIVAFTDDDVVPKCDWLSRIVSSFDADPSLEFVFGQLKAPPYDGRQGWFPETLLPPNIHEPGQRRKIACLGSGANMSARKSFLRRAGGFDEVLGPTDMYTINSDAALAYKAYRSAHWIASAQVEVVHTNGFRPFPELRALFDSYSYELGANYARFVRRGDWRAARLFVLEQWEIIAGAVVAVVRLRRPRRLRSIPHYIRGFTAGLRLDPKIGHVDGDAFQRMERERSLGQ